MSAPTKSFATLEASVSKKKDDYVPHEVAQRVLTEKCSPAQSWREFLGKTTSEIAKKMGISETEYIQLEALPKLTRRSVREQVAGALGISSEQLKF
jgi:DNA-directed RNA polymerase specialized sigma subunit